MRYIDAMKKCNIALGILAAILSLAVFAPVSAAESILVTPQKATSYLKPGEKAKKSLLVVNNSSKPVTLRVGIKDVQVADERGNIKFVEKSGVQSAASWLIPQYNLLNIQPANSVTLEYIVAPHEDMPGGGYAGAFSFQLYDRETKQVMGGSFGSIVALNVIGEGITTGGAVGSVKTPMAQFVNPAKFGFTIKNYSNSNLSLSGDIAFSNIFGKRVGQFETGSLELYPNSTRLFEFKWTDNPLFGIYKGQVTLENAMRRDNTISFPMWFLFLPWQKSLPALLALLVAAAICVFGYRYYRRRISDAKLLGFAEPKGIATPTVDETLTTKEE